MAIPAQGMTITWGGTSLAEVREIDIQQERGQPLQRFGTWTFNRGTIRIAAFSTAGVPDSDYSLKRTLTIAAPVAGTLFTGPCVYENRQTSVEANDAVRFDFTFTISD